MKILRQFGLILAITFAGEVLKALLPLPIPASIYGMVIMLVGLVSGLLRLEDVQDVGDFLIEIMPILFVPAAVGLMDSWGTMKALLLPSVVMLVVVTVLVIVVTGRVTQDMIRRKKGKHELFDFAMYLFWSGSDNCSLPLWSVVQKKMETSYL